MGYNVTLGYVAVRKEIYIRVHDLIEWMCASNMPEAADALKALDARHDELVRAYEAEKQSDG